LFGAEKRISIILIIELLIEIKTWVSTRLSVSLGLVPSRLSISLVGDFVLS
jgi:hypothetical protein